MARADPFQLADEETVSGTGWPRMHGPGRCRALSAGAGQQQLTGSLLGETVLLHMKCLLLVYPARSTGVLLLMSIHAPALGVVTF